MPQRGSLGKRLGVKGGVGLVFSPSQSTKLYSYSADRIKQYKRWDAGNFCQKSTFFKWKQHCTLLEVGSHFGSRLQNLTSSNPKREILWSVCLTFSGVDWNPVSLCLSHPLTSFLSFSLPSLFFPFSSLLCSLPPSFFPFFSFSLFAYTQYFKKKVSSH